MKAKIKKQRSPFVKEDRQANESDIRRWLDGVPCNAFECDRRIDPETFMCPFHWRLVAPDLKRAIENHQPHSKPFTDVRKTGEYGFYGRKAIRMVAVFEGKADRLPVCHLQRVISGGQRGADIAGLRAAHKCGLETGGWMPKGFKTLDGPKPEYSTLYGMRETPSEEYPERTRRNVRDADATIRFATNFGSPGELCTYKALHHYRRPYLDIDLKNCKIIPGNVSDWIIENEFRTLNIAGNALEDWEGWIQFYLEGVFQIAHEIRSEQNQPPSWDHIPYGTHKDEPISEVPIGYLKWFLRDIPDTGTGLRESVIAEIKNREDGIA